MLFFSSSQRQKGYILLLSLLVVGAIGISISIGILLVGVGSSQNGIVIEQGLQARMLSHTCAEYALDELRKDDSYSGNETLSFTEGDCEVRPVLGTGNTNRTVQTIGTTGQANGRVEVEISVVSPEVTISSWKEVGSF